MMKKILSGLSLRTLVALMVGALVLVALAFAVGAYRDSRTVSRHVRLMVERNETADVCLEAADSFFAERSHALVYLLGGLRIPEEQRALLDERRRVGDELLERTLVRVTEAAARGERRRSLAAAVRSAWEHVRESRSVLDRALASPRDGRDPAVAELWTAVTDALAIRLLDLAHEVADAPQNDDAGLERFSQLRHSSILLRTVFSAESGIFAMNLLSVRPVTAREIAALELLRTQSMIVWEGLEQGIRQVGDDRTRDLLGKIHGDLLDPLRKRQGEVLQAARRGAPVAGNGAYARDYAPQALKAADTMSELAAEIRRLTDEYTAGRLAQASLRERHALLGIGLILTLAALAAAVFFFRLGLPLRVIQRRLDGLLEKHFRDAPGGQPLPGGDECAQINFALQLLEESIGARERSDRNLRRHERISFSILKALRQSVIATDSEGNITLFSPGAETMLGYAAEEVIGKQTPMLFHDPEEVRRRARELTEELGVPVAAAFPALIAKARATGRVDEREWTYIRKNGTRLTVLLSITVFGDDQGNLLCCGVATDITERSQVAAEMSRLANYDPLTQLPNRRLFHDRIRMAIVQARRESASLGLLMIDLDRFKPVNDQYGHSVGDLLLGAVAGRMQKCLRESDTLARVGGDEFVAILPTIGSAADAVGVAKKIRQSLCAPFHVTDDITVNIDCSIGVALYPDHGGNEDSLLKSADDAMYIAKGLGRAQVFVAGGGREGELAGEPCGGQEMGTLVWRRSYQCGEATIDQEHKNLFIHGNAIIRAVASGRVSPDKLPEMLEKLIAAVAVHFRNEEEILARHGYAGLDEHVLKHRALTERAQELYRLAITQELPMGDVVAFVTRDVVAQHMLIDDHDFFPFLKKALQPDPVEVP